MQQEVFKKTNPRLQQGVFESFSRESNRQMFCDFIVKIENVEFPCHKFVLNACSGFFGTIFLCNKEKKTTIQGISPEIFQLILDVLYGGSDVITKENMIEMWNAGHQLQVEFLMSECENFVLKNINSQNCYTVYCNAELLQSAIVLEFVLSFMVKNFFSVVNSENFIKLQYEDVIKILQNSQLPVCADFQMEAILKWCGAEYKGKKSRREKNCRESCLGNLMQAVCLRNVSKQCLASLLTNDVIQENKQAVALVNSQAAKCLTDIPDQQSYYTYGHIAQSYQDVWGYGERNNGIPQKNKKVASCQHCQNKK